MTVGYPRHDLLEVLASLGFLHFPVFGNKIE
jgi:hypothetical protein